MVMHLAGAALKKLPLFRLYSTPFFIGSAMTIASCIGANIFPILSGQLLEDNPMILMYLMAATIFLYSLMFLLAIFIGREVESGKETPVTKTWNCP